MGHLIPMNLQLNAEVGDKGTVKGDIVPSSGEEGGSGAPGKWPASSMNGLQCPGGAGGRHLALCPTLLDRATKASLIPISLLQGEVGGSSTPAWPPPRAPSKEVPLGMGG